MASCVQWISISWEESQPDGSRCRVCDDCCYLKMWQLVYLIGQTRKQYVSEFFICGSCHETINEAPE